jgi:leucyl/phenylalanyl-tRNA--protein transferase
MGHADAAAAHRLLSAAGRRPLSKFVGRLREAMIRLNAAAPAKTASLTPAVMLRAYRRGRFPMTLGPDAPDLFRWRRPWSRGILPLDRFCLQSKIRSMLRKDRFAITVDSAFRSVVEGCAEVSERHPEPWLTPDLCRVYGELHDAGHAHSLEAWRNGALAGGLFGVQIGSVWFGESMFMRETGASQVALAHLVARLIAGGFTLFDVQWATAFMCRFGTEEINHLRYRWRLAFATRQEADFRALPLDRPGAEILQLIRDHARPTAA